MQASKKVTKGGGVTIPRGIRQETGILPGVPVDITTNEDGIHIQKHVPACFHCGTVDDVKMVLRSAGNVQPRLRRYSDDVRCNGNQSKG